MEHSFDITVAKEYGVIEAVFIKHFQFWIIKNKANGNHYHDGRTWTFNSMKAFGDIFPYLSTQTIRTTLKHLIEKNVITTGNYHLDQTKRSLWYAFVDEDYWTQQIHLLKSTNALVSPTNSIYTDNIHTDNKESTHFVRTEEKQTNSKDWDLTFIRADYTPCVLEWLTHKKKIKKGYKTEAGVKKMYNALFQMSSGDASIAQMIIDQSIANNWDGLFPLKTGTTTMSKLQQQEQESYERQKRVLEMMAESERRKQNGDYGVARGIADLFG